MDRVMIVGNIASGKSTFAKKLQNLTGLELFHLDILYVQNNGEQAPLLKNLS